jgi:hypothetical protein
VDLDTTARPDSSEPPAQVYSWHQKLSSVLFAIFCFEMGIFLIVFPWLGSWQTNYFAWIAPESSLGAWVADGWRGTWASPYFRGAISGLGLVNVYISLVQVIRLRRFSAGASDDE